MPSPVASARPSPISARRGETLTRKLINFCRHLGYQSLIEGVETAEQDAFLRDTECRYAKGGIYAQPMTQASMMGRPMFSDPVEISLAYLFCLCRNHPFLGGNKRTALAACSALEAGFPYLFRGNASRRRTPIRPSRPNPQALASATLRPKTPSPQTLQLVSNSIVKV